jgi:hydroxymethylpyrimidine/phosphomethylpyrimidine kinase
MSGRRSPRLLTIAGSDSGGGAGIQADLRTFAAHGAFGTSAVTALTAQNTLGVRAVHAVPAAMVGEQIDAVLDDIGADAIKVGMLADAEIVAVVAERLGRLRASAPIPVVLDPVMIAASGAALLATDAVAALRDRLAPLATLLTPNLPEGEALAGRSGSGLGDRLELARALGRSAPAVLLKGAHAPGDEIVDLLWDGRTMHEIRHPRIATRAGHGTGCSLSSAIAARLARGEELLAACRGAIDWLAGALAAAEPIGSGAGPVDQLWTLRGDLPLGARFA